MHLGGGLESLTLRDLSGLQEVGRFIVAAQSPTGLKLVHRWSKPQRKDAR